MMMKFRYVLYLEKERETKLTEMFQVFCL